MELKLLVKTRIRFDLMAQTEHISVFLLILITGEIQSLVSRSRNGDLNVFLLRYVVISTNEEV
jgi:hypothetical protein